MKLFELNLLFRPGRIREVILSFTDMQSCIRAEIKPEKGTEIGRFNKFLISYSENKFRYVDFKDY